MSEQTTNFVGTVPEFYDRDMGPVIFADFADDMARRAVAAAPTNVLELAAGTGPASSAAGCATCCRQDRRLASPTSTRRC